MGFPIGSVVLMLILAVGMFYGQAQYKKKRAEWGKLLTIVCGILIIITAMWTNLCRSNIDITAINREKQYQAAQCTILANTLANMYNGNGKCLLIHHPIFNNNTKDIERLTEAFDLGFGGKVTEIRQVPIKVITGDDMMAEEAMLEMTADDFNKVIEANSDCDMVITLVPLPFSEDQLYKIGVFEMLPDEDDPSIYIRNPDRKYPLLGVYNGYIGNLEPLFLDGLIGAMTLWKPNPTIDEKDVPESVQEAFNKRYLVITPQNVEATKEKFSSLFPKPRK
jgi:hypothetical protein